MTLKPLGVGVEEQKDDEGKGEDVGVEEKEDAAMVETPAAAEAANRLPGAPAGEQRGKDEQQRGMDIGEAAQDESQDDAADDERGSPEERPGSYIEDGVLHGRGEQT